MSKFRKLFVILLAVSMMITQIPVANMEAEEVAVVEFGSDVAEVELIADEEPEAVEAPAYFYAKVSAEEAGVYAAIGEDAFATLSQGTVILVVDAKDADWYGVAFKTDFGLEEGVVAAADLAALNADELEAYLDAIGQDEVELYADDVDYPLTTIEVTYVEYVDEIVEEAAAEEASDAGSGITITTQPASVSATLGSDVTFSVVAQSTGLTYQWQWGTAGHWYSISSSESARTANYTLKAYQSMNGRSYRCIITDTNGNTEISAEAVLTIVEGPRITVHPVDVAAVLRSDAVFTVVAEGTGLTYQWQWGAAGKWYNISAASAKTDTYTIVASQSMNGRSYRCVVTDSNGNTATSNAAVLTIVEGPTITVHPVDVAAVLRSDAVFTVVAEGTGLTYQWQWGAAGKWYNISAASAKTDTYTIVASQSMNGRSYRCVVTDANGNTATSNAAVLTIVEGPTITVHPVDVTAKRMTDATFTVAAEGTGLTYQWQWGAAGKWYSISAASAKTDTYTIVASQSMSGRSYRCIVTDANGNTATSNAAVLTVVEGPTITVQPVDVTARLNDDAVFTVTAEGTGLTYQWQWGTADKWYSISAESAKTASYTIKASQSMNGRSYRCIVTDSNGISETSSAAVLTVVNGPKITVQPVDVSARLNDDAVFTVEAEGTGLTYQWQWGTAGKWYSISAASAKTASYTIKATQSMNGRSYRCIVTDSNGNSETSDEAVLTVLNQFLVDNVLYELIDGVMTVIGYEGEFSSYTVQATVNGVTVTEIGEEAFMDNRYLVSIDLPDTITVIHARAFKNCSNLSDMH